MEYRESGLYQNVMQELDQMNQSMTDMDNRKEEATNYNTSFLYQVSRSVFEKFTDAQQDLSFCFIQKTHNLSLMIDRCSVPIN